MGALHHRPLLSLLSFLLSVCLLVSCQQTQPEGLTLYMSFDDPSPTSIGTSNCPYIGFPTTGAMAGTLVDSRDGFGKAIHYPTAQANAALNATFPSAEYLNKNLFNQNSFSMLAWVKADDPACDSFTSYNVLGDTTSISAAGENHALSVLAAGNGSTCKYYVNGAVSFVGQSPTIFRDYPLDGDPHFLPGDWAHIAIVWDGYVIRGFLNGVELSSPRLPPDAEMNNYVNPNIGVSGRLTGFLGTIDEVRVYNSALDGDAINAIYTLNSPLVEPSPITFNADPVYSIKKAADKVNLYAEGDSSLTYYWGDESTCPILQLPVTGNVGQNISFPVAGLGEVDLYVGAKLEQWGLCYTVGPTTISINGSAPGFESEPESQSVYLGEVSSVSANIYGFPLPTMRWERKTIQEVVTVNGTRINQTVFIAITGQNSNILQLTNNGGKFLGGATRRSYRADDFSSLTVRLLLRNEQVLSPIPSAEIVLTALDFFRPSSGDGDSDDETLVAIIVPVVVVPLLLCCLLLIIILIVAVILIRRRGSGYNGMYNIKLEEPDYAELAYGSLLESHYTATNKQLASLKRFEELLLDSDYVLTRIICENAKATEADNLAKVVTIIYAAHNEAVGLIQYFIGREVETSKKEGTLFRANSIASKMFTTYSRITALPYVWSIFARPVAELNAMAQQLGRDEEEGFGSGPLKSTLLGPVVMEVDPSKMDEATDEKVNTLQLWLVAQKLFTSLEASRGSVPSDVRQILKHVQTEVSRKFSEQAAHKAMGGFLFLRLLCPSLMAPQVYGILKDPPHPTAQRQLILIAKVMQNLSNDTMPGKKEQYMERLNEFITSNQAALRRFYENLIANPYDGSRGAENVPNTVKNNALVHLYRYVLANYDRVSALVGQEDEKLANELHDIVNAVGDIEVDDDL